MLEKHTSKQISTSITYYLLPQYRGLQRFSIIYDLRF